MPYNYTNTGSNPLLQGVTVTSPDNTGGTITQNANSQQFASPEEAQRLATLLGMQSGGQNISMPGGTYSQPMQMLNGNMNAGLVSKEVGQYGSDPGTYGRYLVDRDVAATQGKTIADPWASGSADPNFQAYAKNPNVASYDPFAGYGADANRMRQESASRARNPMTNPYTDDGGGSQSPFNSSYGTSGGYMAASRSAPPNTGTGGGGGGPVQPQPSPQPGSQPQAQPAGQSMGAWNGPAANLSNLFAPGRADGITDQLQSSRLGQGQQQQMQGYRQFNSQMGARPNSFMSQPPAQMGGRQQGGQLSQFGSYGRQSNYGSQSDGNQGQGVEPRLRSHPPSMEQPMQAQPGQQSQSMGQMRGPSSSLGAHTGPMAYQSAMQNSSLRPQNSSVTNRTQAS